MSATTSSSSSSSNPGSSSGSVLTPPDGDSSIASLQHKIAAVEEQIRIVEAAIKKAEEKLEKGCNNEAETQHWRKKEEQLREEKQQLRKEKEQLRDDLREEKKQQQLLGKARHYSLLCAIICTQLSSLDACSVPSQLVYSILLSLLCRFFFECHFNRSVAALSFGSRGDALEPVVLVGCLTLCS